MTSRNVPRLRFKGFGDEWKKEKLNDMSETFSGGTPKVGNKSYYDGDIAFIRSSEVLGKRPVLRITKSGLDNSSAKLVDKNTLLYALYGATSGSVGLSKNAGAINQAVLAIIPDESHSKLFLKDVLYLKKNHIVSKFLQGGQGNLSAKIIKQLNIYFPLLSEQQRIGSFFSKLDHLIYLHSQKLEQLKKLKHGYLQKMFPQKGETVPCLRFSGFSGEWKKVKLGDLVDINTGKSKYTKHDFCDNYKYPILGSTELLGYDDSFDYDGNFVLIARVGDAGQIYTCSGKSKITDNTIFFSTDTPNFLSELINSVGLHRLVFGSGRKLIKSSDLKKLNVHVPNKEEQNRLEKFINNFDDIISNEQLKINVLRKQKKSYLQKMFI